MKKILLALALTGLFGVPAFAQQVDGPSTPQPEMSQAEMLAQLHRLMDKASNEMSSAEKELARASLAANKADVLAERIKALREQMGRGELGEVPEGLRDYIRDNPQEAADFSGRSVEDLKKLADNQAEFDKFIRGNAELLKKLSQSDDACNKVLELQYNAERQLAETLKRQQDTIKAARQNQDDAINLAHQLQSSGQSGDPSKDPSGTRHDQPGGDKTPGGDKSTKPGHEYIPGAETKPGSETEEHTTNVNPDGFHTEKPPKPATDTAGGGETSEPSKYKGFWEKFTREMQKHNTPLPKKDNG